MTAPKVTILIPNYKTPQLTKLCLRLIRKYTDPLLAKVIVVDNDSQDESLDYLRSLSWITLIERKTDPSDTASAAHAKALDMALEQTNTPYVLSIHTDTLVKHHNWLNFLLRQIEGKGHVASIGSWKLETKSFIKRTAKKIERFFQILLYLIINKNDHAIQGIGKNHYYLRSHCALYRTDLIRAFNLTFSAENDTAGKTIHRIFNENGLITTFLPTEILEKYIDHLNHATSVLNPELGSRKKTITKGNKRIKRKLKKLNAYSILNDDSLDK